VSDKGVDEGGEAVSVQENIVSAIGAPTTFANGFVVVGQIYGFQLIFTLKNGPADPAVPVANVHISPELAKVIGRLIRRNVLGFEERVGGPIRVPDQLLDELGVRDLEE